MAQTVLPYGDIASNVNQFMQGQAMLPFLQNLPGYSNMVGQRSNVIEQQLAGEVPQDVVNQLIQRAAERGVAGGFGAGSPNSNAALLRALGQTSLGVQQQGMQNLSQAIEDTPRAELWNPMSLYVPQYLAQQELSAQRAAENRATATQIAQDAATSWNTQPSSSTRYYYTSWGH